MDPCKYEPTCLNPIPLYMGGLTCTASSKAGSNKGCDKAIDGSSIGWSSNAEDIGAWIKIDFHQDVALTAIGLVQKSIAGKGLHLPYRLVI